uniref:Uncharacterized protein n=1 Tax=Manihot esculenta TaxID=3983 RepID=A0A2C9U8K5_MANES
MCRAFPFSSLGFIEPGRKIHLPNQMCNRAVDVSQFRCLPCFGKASLVSIPDAFE